MTGCGHDPLMIHALIDHELDGANAAMIEQRIAACADCAAEQARLLALREALGAARVSAPDRLRRRLAASLRGVEPQGPRRAPAAGRRPWAWMGGGAGLAIAACALGLMVAIPWRDDRALTRDLIDDHVRSLQVAHLTDVETSDQHVVKPWFGGKLDFSPPVIELKDQGFPLVGGRLDYLNHRTVAAIVYRRGRHVINLFVWPDAGANGPGATRAADGYTLRHWRAGGMTFWAVSDVNPADLTRFEAELEARTARPGP